MMRKVLLTVLAVILIVGALGAAGFTGYRFGYAQGLSAGSDGQIQRMPHGFGMGPQRMPGQNFGFDREFGRGEFPMMRRGSMGFGFFSPLWFLLQVAFWGLVIYAIYTLIVRSGWRITRTTTTSTVPPAATTTETAREVKE